jgi:integrase/recombinase XerD
MSKSNQDHFNKQSRMDGGNLAPHVVEFTRHLSGLGHTRRTTSDYADSARHFASWLARTKTAVADIDNASIDQFSEHRCRCCGKHRAECISKKYLMRVRRFVEFLADHGIVKCGAKAPPNTHDRRVIEFEQWLRQHRGNCEQTIERYGRMIMRLLPALGNRPRSYDAHVIREAIVAESGRASIATVKGMTTALRGYLRFLGARGLCRPGLEHAVLSSVHRRLSGLPRYIGTSDVERLIATCDLTTSLGIRDRAILLLLARLGLRAGDICSLRMGNIDWEQATLCVCGKGRRETRLPLPQDAGDALLAYLDRARPAVTEARIFFMSKAPIRPLTRSSVVSKIVSSAIRKAGIATPSRGANLLRHSAATAMLRGGATLDMVGAVLRHRSPDTTAHYAKVDVMVLQQVAQPWPGDA